MARYLPALGAFRVASVHEDEVILLTAEQARDRAQYWRSEAVRAGPTTLAARYQRMAREADDAAAAVEAEASKYPTLARWGGTLMLEAA